MVKLHLALFAVIASERPAGDLESRMKRFLEANPRTESLDAAAFSKKNGAKRKADYLLEGRRFVAELKTINGDPKERLEKRLKERFAQKDAPIVFGAMGLARILEGMRDEQELLKMVVDVASRAVRRHLQQSNDQISETKIRHNLPGAQGLAVIMNDSEPMINVSNIGYAIGAAIDAVEGGYPEIPYLWVNVECHKIRLPDGNLGYPQLLVSRPNAMAWEINFLHWMLLSWATFNGSELMRINHHSDWNTIRPVFDDGPPVLEPF